MRLGGAPVPIGFIKTGAIDGELDALLTQSVARGLPMVCANPDLYVALPGGGGRRGHMPGLVAREYDARGGRVQYFGKPHAPAFEACLKLLGEGAERTRVLHVGDSLMHDVAGASEAGVHSLFVAGGIHADELGLHEGVASEGELQPERLAALFAEYGARPTYTAAAFTW